jgi:hypothetical protein
MKNCDKSSKSLNFLTYKLELCKKEGLSSLKKTEMLALIICSDVTEFKFLNSYSSLKTTMKCSYITYRTISLQYHVHVTVHRNKFLTIKPTRCTNFTNYFGMNLYMFRTVPLSIIRSTFTVHSAMVYVIQLSSRTLMELCSFLVLLESCLQTCMAYTIAECTVNKLLMMDTRTVRNM